MRFFLPACALGVAALMLVSGCGGPSPADEARVYPPGEQVPVEALIYNVLDSRILTRLGDDPATAHFPKDRFFQVQISVKNSGKTDESIPGLALVDDSGKTYHELTNGFGATDWLGVVRTVKHGETAQGSVLFDAPAKHYHLRLTADYETPEIAIDLPMSFSHAEPGGAQ